MEVLVPLGLTVARVQQVLTEVQEHQVHQEHVEAQVQLARMVVVEQRGLMEAQVPPGHQEHVEVLVLQETTGLQVRLVKQVRWDYRVLRGHLVQRGRRVPVVQEPSVVE